MRKLMLVVVFVLFGGECWADAVTDKLVETYQLEVTKAGALFDATVQASTAKAVKQLDTLEARSKDDEAKSDIQLVSVQLQSGSLAPAFVDPRQFDVKPLPWAPLTEVGLDGVVVIKAKIGIVELAANEQKGQLLGYFKAGTVVSFRFVGGMYRIGGYGGVPVREIIDPDAAGTTELITCVASGARTVIAKMPGQTALTPYVFKIVKDGEYRLAPRLKNWGANLGFSAFEIKLGGG